MIREADIVNFNKKNERADYIEAGFLCVCVCVSSITKDIHHNTGVYDAN